MSILNSSKLCNTDRRIPLLVFCHVLFGDLIQQIGWWFLGLGLFFFWVFGANADWLSRYQFSGELASAHALILSVSETGGTVSKELKSKQPIRAYRYRFSTPDGHDYDNVSYTDFKNDLRNGDIATVEYQKNNPRISRIRGMRNAVFEASPAVVLTVLFPISSLFLIMPGLIRGFRSNRLLKSGMLALGHLKSCTRFKSKILKREKYRLVFNIQSTIGVANKVIAIRNIMWTDKETQVLFNSREPANAILLTDIPGMPKIRESGKIVSKDKKGAILSIILPILTVLGHGSYSLFFFAA